MSEENADAAREKAEKEGRDLPPSECFICHTPDPFGEKRRNGDPPLEYIHAKRARCNGHNSRTTTTIPAWCAARARTTRSLATCSAMGSLSASTSSCLLVSISFCRSTSALCHITDFALQEGGEWQLCHHFTNLFRVYILSCSIVSFLFFLRFFWCFLEHCHFATLQKTNRKLQASKADDNRRVDLQKQYADMSMDTSRATLLPTRQSL